MDEADLYCFENKVVLKAIFGLLLFIAALKKLASALKSLQLSRKGSGIRKHLKQCVFIIIFQMDGIGSIICETVYNREFWGE